MKHSKITFTRLVSASAFAALIAGIAGTAGTAATAGAADTDAVNLNNGLRARWSFDELTATPPPPPAPAADSAKTANAKPAKKPQPRGRHTPPPTTFAGDILASPDNATDIFPLTGNGRAQSVAGATVTTGKGVALNGALFSAPPAVLPENIRDLSFAIWVRPQRFAGCNTLFRKEDGEYRLLFAFQNDGRFLTLGLNCGGNYAELDAPVAADELLDGRWHHLAGTFADNDRVMRVFLDGRLIGSVKRGAPLNTAHDFVNGWFRDSEVKLDDAAAAKAAKAGIKIPRYAPGAPFNIGAHSGTAEPFFGALDDARFYDRALSPAEVRELAKRPAPTNLDSANTAQLAKKSYQKRASFEQTLADTAAPLQTAAGELVKKSEPSKGKSAPANTDAKLRRLVVETHRLLAGDFPAETNAYVVKWQKSPAETLLLNDAARRDRLAKLAQNAFEYLPLAQHQWDVLSAGELAKWKRAKSIKESFENGAPVTAGDVFFVEELFQERPREREAVASYRTPQTPATRDRSADEANAVLEREWLFQCDNKPTFERTLAEIGYARAIAKRHTDAGVTGDKQATIAAALEKLDALEKEVTTALAAEKKAQEDAAAATAATAATGSATAAGTTSPLPTYLAVRAAKRAIFLASPAIDFDSVLYIDNPFPSGSEWQHETRHRLGYMAVPGGRLLVQRGLSPAGKLTQLAPAAPLHGSFWRPDLSFDASRVLFSFKPHNEKTFHLYEIGLDGKNLRQLTAGMFDDFDPIYLPDQKNILFTTTRGYLYVRCMPPTNAMVTAKMPLNVKPGDKSLYLISRNGEPEYTPSVMDDGRILFTRWEYTDKPLWRAQKLWTMSQNGELVQTFWGNQSVWPDLMKDARSIPGSKRVMFTGSAHHNWFSGSVGIIDPAKGLNFPNGLTKVTQEVHWPECGNGPVDPKENDTYHTAGKYTAYYSPYPLSEKEFLVSARRSTQGSRNGKFVLLFMDADGNRELINEGEHNIWDAQPVRPRKAPPAQHDKLAWPDFVDREKPDSGVIYSNNVYEGAPEELRDKAKFLRIWSIEHKTYTYWSKRPYLSTGPELSANQSEGIKRIIGTVPIEADGSVNFRAPSGIALHFQLLDGEQRALQTMKSFTGVQPGEVRGCFGCHEMHMNSAQGPRIGTAMRRAPSPITPVPWNDITVGYVRYVQSGLDAYCADCHSKDGSAANKAFNSRLRPGFLGFKEPYMTLMGNPTWGSPYHHRKGTGAFGWADTILVESYSTVDPKAYVTYPPLKKLSYASRLVKRFAGEKVYPTDKHPKVEVDDETLLRVKLWVDAMGPYSGVEELRAKEDPVFQGSGWISQPPRIHSAPLVRRPGPFDVFHPELDPAYAPPSPASYNALPSGVTRPQQQTVAAGTGR